MAISSASNTIFKAEDPILETDLQLLSKVNEFQQDRFDMGEKALQSEINNWSLLNRQAKPQDRDYVNKKLNNLVSGIKNLGGVDLSDPNNVNSLKNLGYSLYGDDNIMNPLITTRKMEQLEQDIYTKTNGKDAKNYDSTMGEYLMSKYGKWLNDGQQGTKFDGPTALPQGNFNEYTTRINAVIAKLRPDMNEAPQDSKDAALNYYQVGDKFIKKDRIKAAIDANTSEQDRSIIEAHAWKSMQGLSDNQILDLQRRDYDSNARSLQDQYNEITRLKSLTTDFNQKQLFQSQLDELHNGKGTGAIDVINGQKNSLPVLKEGERLPEQVRQGLSNSLFYGSYKDQIASANAFEEKKVQLKTNEAAVANQKLTWENYWHGKDYDLKEKEFNLKVQAEQAKEENNFLKFYSWANGGLTNPNSPFGGGFRGPANNAPLSLVPVPGKDDAFRMSNDTLTQADANYTAASKNFYENGYNYLMSQDSVLYGKFLKQDNDGNWVPKDDNSSKVVNKALESFVGLYGNIANMSLDERKGLKLNDDTNQMFQKAKELEEATLYKTQMADVAAEAFRRAGKENPYTKSITIHFNNGKNKVDLTYAKLKEMIDKKDPLLEEWEKSSNFDVEDQIDPLSGATLHGTVNETSNAINDVKDYYNDARLTKAWDDVSKTFNPYARVISLPKDKKGKLPDQVTKVLVDAIKDQGIKADVNEDDVDLNKVWTVMDPKTLQPKYMAEVRYRKANKSTNPKKEQGDRTTNVDVTDLVNSQAQAGGGWLSSQYSQDNAAVVYGFALQSEGKTPFDPNNNFDGALQTHGDGLLTHKYQVVAVKDPNTKGITGYKVFVAIPLGKDDTGKPKFQVMNVPNFYSDASGKTTTFPANFEGVRQYMESAFRDQKSAADFYVQLGIPQAQALSSFINR